MRCTGPQKGILRGCVPNMVALECRMVARAKSSRLTERTLVITRRDSLIDGRSSPQNREAKT